MNTAVFTIQRFLRILCILISIVSISSCGSTKPKKKARVVTKTTPQTAKGVKKGMMTTPQKIQNIIAYAKAFEGTRYQYGGTTKRGMDCSGLVYTAFQKAAIPLPRTSRAMAAKGTAVKLQKVAVGDLLFFNTARVKKNINHVGIVVSIDDGVQFIHASVSKGVTISSLAEKYWNRTYVKAKRIL